MEKKIRIWGNVSFLSGIILLLVFEKRNIFDDIGFDKPNTILFIVMIICLTSGTILRIIELIRTKKKLEMQ